jgi:phage terminase large subunit-like protein
MRYDVRRILVDPFQMHRSISTLAAAGLPIEEYPQTTANTTAMGTALLDVVTGRNLWLYPSEELRSQALNTVAIESPRGGASRRRRRARRSTRSPR